jgi:catabolite regulation protein CreA
MEHPFASMILRIYDAENDKKNLQYVKFVTKQVVGCFKSAFNVISVSKNRLSLKQGIGESGNTGIQN